MKTLVKKQSKIGQQREKNAGQIERICQLLGWTHDTYTSHQFYEYEMFIAEACALMPRSSILLRYSPQFRGFFNNEWMRRNEYEFLPFANNAVTDEYEIQFEYEQMRSKKWEIIESGINVIPGVEYGAEFLIEEYLITHSHQSLFCDADFCNRYKHMITKILPYV